MKTAYEIDQKSGIPIYVQLMNQIKHRLATGELQHGDQLPTIRELAVDLAVNLHTVAHAYAELEREGFLSIQRGRGTFISNGHITRDEYLDDMRRKQLQALVEGVFANALKLGYDVEEVAQAVRKHLEQWQESTK